MPQHEQAQDSGGAGGGSGGFNFGQAALSVLAGAASGSATGSIAGGLATGVQQGIQMSERRRRNERADRQEQQQQQANEQRMRSSDLSQQRQQQVIDQTQHTFDTRDFNEEMELYGKLGQSSALNFQKEYAATATRPRDTDGTMTYGISEAQALEIDAHTRASKTMTNTKMYISALERSINSTNPNEFKESDRMQRVLGSQLGFNYIEGSEGVPAQIQTPWGAFPADMESAPKIMARATEEATAARKHYEATRRMKSSAESGATRAMMDQMENMGSLNSKEASALAEDYTNMIMGNDFTARSHGLAHSLDFLVNNRGGDMTQGEAVIMSNVLDKFDVEYEQRDNGDYMIKASDVNDYVNRYLPENEKQNVIDSGDWVSADDALVQAIYNNSGVTAIRDRFTQQAQEMNNRNVERGNDQFMRGLSQQRVKDLSSAETKQVAEQQKTINRANSLDPKLSIDETVENFEIPVLTEGGGKTKLADNPQLVDGLRFEAQNKAMQESVRSKIPAQQKREYEATFGRDLQEDLEDFDTATGKEAVRFMRERGKLEIDDKRVDFHMRDGMKSLKTKRGVRSLLKRMDAQTRGPQEATERQQKADEISGRILGSSPAAATDAGQFETPGTGFVPFDEG